MTAAGWFRDPTGRHELRWWDGGIWSEYVADAGTVSVDPAGADPPPPVPALPPPPVPALLPPPPPPSGRLPPPPSRRPQNHAGATLAAIIALALAAWFAYQFLSHEGLLVSAKIESCGDASEPGVAVADVKVTNHGTRTGISVTVAFTSEDGGTEYTTGNHWFPSVGHSQSRGDTVVGDDPLPDGVSYGEFRCRVVSKSG